MTPPTPTPGLHVLIAARGYPAFDDPRRGIFVADQAVALRDAGVHVAVASWETAARISSGPATGPDPETPQAWIDAIETRATFAVPHSWGGPGVPVVRLPATATAHGKVPADLLSVAEREAESLRALRVRLPGRRIDLIHAHTGLPDGVAAARASREWGIPLVVTEHASTLAASLTSDRARAAYRELIGPGCRLIAVSGALRREIARLIEVEDSTIEVVPNIVAVESFAPVGPEARDPDELLWVGARTAGKGTDTLLRAFHLLRADRPGLRLRLLGRAPDAGEEARLRSLAGELHVADAVTFEPPADRGAVAAAMARAAVFVHASPHETFGLVAAEALASGLPVAATPSGGVEEIVGTDGQHGEIAAGTDERALAAAVERVLARRASFDPAGLRRAVTERYSAATVAARLIAIYLELLPADRSGRAADDTPWDLPVAAGGPGPALPLVVGMRRSATKRRIEEVPRALAADLKVVTAVDDAGPARTGGPVPFWLELGGPRPPAAQGRPVGPDDPGSSVRRIVRAVRHPRWTIALRGSLAGRGGRADQTLAATRAAIARAMATLLRDRASLEVLALDADDVDLVGPLLGERIRLYPSTLRGLVDAWDAADRATEPHG